MHLHTLSFQAIGPFDGRHTIDFSALGASGLFLLEGPTGAGKSTIIDAVVFALYGGIAGSHSSNERLHSQHAAPGVEPFVELTFSTQAGSYRIRRSPQHLRPKKRGSDGAMTTQNETVALSRMLSLDEPDRVEPISTRGQEVGSEILRLIGLRKEQFLQTVVLPQGEFARFLRAKGEERKDLLKTIFRTGIYEQVTEQLQLMRSACGTSIKDSKARVNEALAAFAAAAQRAVTDNTGELDAAAVGRMCHRTHEEAVGAAEVAQRADAIAQAALAAAEMESAAQRQLAEALVRRYDLLERKAKLAAEGTSVVALRQQLARSRSAARVAISAQGLARAAAMVAAAQTRRATARAAYGEAYDDQLDLGERRDALRQELSALAELLVIEQALPARHQQLGAKSDTLAALAQRMVRLEAETESAPATLATLEAELAADTAAAHALPAARASEERAAGILAAVRGVRALDERLAALTTQRDALVSAAHLANDTVHSLRQRRLDEYAGELAIHLVPSEPCAVCGSTEHPRPAELVDDHPSDADIQAAEHELKKSTLAADDATERCHDAQRKREGLLARTEGHSADTATIACAAAVRQREAAQAAAERVGLSRTALIEAKRVAAEATEALSAAKVLMARLTAERDALATALDDDATRITAALGGRCDTLTALHQQLQREQALADGLIAATDEHRAGVLALSGRQKELDEGLAANGFVDAEAAGAAALDEAAMARLVTRIDAYTSESTLIESGLAEPDVATLSGDELVDVDGAVAAVAAARAAAAAAHAQAGVLTAQASAVAKELSNVDATLAAYESAIESFGAIERLTGVAEGNHAANARRLSLGTFVLMRRFQDVVDAANARYGPMSDGRYRLVHIEEKEGRKAGNRTGLALSVFDGETGRQREPRTLSGGETFNASLCLALGLADVVTGESGGIELGTLFVDEGFGSLDSESLDRVMAELGKLSKGGRVVGIVSHVDELKQRVADRIEVRHKAGGASTLTVRANVGAPTG